MEKIAENLNSGKSVPPLVADKNTEKENTQHNNHTTHPHHHPPHLPTMIDSPQ